MADTMVTVRHVVLIGARHASWPFLLASACFHPNYDHPTCGPNRECPSGMICSTQLSNTCVPINDSAPDAGVDGANDGPNGGPIDGGPVTKCSSSYAPVAGSAHFYKALSNVTWDEARMMCNLTSQAAYLAIPDDATELANLAILASPPFWIGIDDQASSGDFVTQKCVPAMFLPWGPGQPDTEPLNDCVDAISATQIATEKCANKHAAVCECEP
jgi:hypothetical protein